MMKAGGTFTAIAAAACTALYAGAVRAGLGRRRAALLAGSAAVLLGGWFTATVVIAGHGRRFTSLGVFGCARSWFLRCACRFTSGCRSRCAMSAGGVAGKRARLWISMSEA